MTRGRPLRFLALVCLGWIGVRVAVLAPSEASSPDAVVPAARVAAVRVRERQLPALPQSALVAPIRIARPQPVALAQAPTVIAAQAASLIPHVVPTESTSVPSPPRPSLAAPLPGGPLPDEVLAPATTASRWRADGWLIARGGGGGSTLTPQLGGSQAGIRVSYRLTETGGPALFVRAARPLEDGASEVAAGVQWQLRAIPLTLLAEVRKPTGQPAAAAVGAFGGIDRDLGRFRLSGYGQAGYAAGRAATLYADGRARLSFTVTRAGPAEFDAGVGGWAAAQRGASRLDFGPSVSAALPIGPGGVRLGLDWRLRAAGKARPESGPALTLAAGF